MDDKGIKDFRAVVGRAVDRMGNEPYDYRKTHESLLAATRRTLEHHEKQKEKEKISTKAKSGNDAESV